MDRKTRIALMRDVDAIDFAILLTLAGAQSRNHRRAAQGLSARRHDVPSKLAL